MLEPQTLRFLSRLKKNNNKEWFEKHRADYEAAKIDFSNFIQLVIEDFRRTDPTLEGITSKDCMFRINRDVRFSKDKSPYKTNFGASIKRGGKKSPYAGYYFHCEPGKSFAGGGMWMPDAPTLKKVRQEIDYNWEEFRSIIQSRAFKKVYSDIYKSSDISLTSLPRGYEKNNPASDYLKLKSVIAETHISDEQLMKGSLHAKTIEAFTALKPLIDFINRALD